MHAASHRLLLPIDLYRILDREFRVAGCWNLCPVYFRRLAPRHLQAVAASFSSLFL